MSFEMTALLLSWVAIAMLAFAVAGLLRQVRYLATDRPGPGPSRLGPPDGRDIATLLPDLKLGEGAAFLLFADRDCRVCEELITDLEMIPAVEGQPPIHVLFKHQVAPNGETVVKIHGDQTEIFDELKIPVTPFAVGVRDGRVAAAGPIGSVAQMGQALAELERKDDLNGYQ